MSGKLGIEELTGPEYSRLARLAPGVILPLASVEIMGAHGPLGADLIVANAVAPLIAEKTRCLHAPAVAFGDTLELSGWEGTVHVPSEVLERYCEAVARSFLERGGVKALVFIAFHSLNLKAADQVCRRLKRDGHRVLAVDWWRAAAARCGDLLADRETGTGHGGEMITSVVMAAREGSVRFEARANERARQGLSRFTRYQLGRGDPYQAYGDFRDYCEGGAWGSVDGAAAEKGREIIARASDDIARFILEALDTKTQD